MLNWIKNLFKKKSPKISQNKELQWHDIEYFRPREFNEPMKMDLKHIQKLDFFRKSLNTKIIITSSFREGNSSQHGKGLATDIMFPNLNFAGLLNAYLEAERYNFGGIGFYVDWKINGELKGGLHLDSRKLDKYGRGARWLSYKDENGKRRYISLDRKNLMNYYFSKL